MGAALGPITAGAGLIEGSQSNKAAQRSANNANAQAQQITQRQTALFDTLFKNAQAGSAALSANSQIGQLSKDYQTYGNLALQGTAGAMRTMGYQPGDSEVNTRLDAVNQKDQQAFGQQANQIRTNAPMQQAALMASPAAALGGLNSALGYDQNQQMLQYSRMQNPAGLVMAAQPFMQPQQNTYNSYYSGGNGFSLPGQNQGVGITKNF